MRDGLRRLLDECLVEEAELFVELAFAHLFDDVGRLASRCGLGAVDFLFVLEACGGDVFAADEEWVDDGDMQHGRELKPVMRLNAWRISLPVLYPDTPAVRGEWRTVDSDDRHSPTGSAKSQSLSTCSTAVLLSLLRRLPGDRYKRTLEEGVVYNVLLVIFAFNDPVPGANVTLSEIGNDRRIVSALARFHHQRSTCAKSIHGLAPSVLNTDKNHHNS